MVKNPSANAGGIRDEGSIPGSGRSPGGGHGNPPQYSCLENPMDIGAWRATVHRIVKSQTGLKRLRTQACMQSLTTPKSRTVLQEKKKSPKSWCRSVACLPELQQVIPKCNCHPDSLHAWGTDGQPIEDSLLEFWENIFTWVGEGLQNVSQQVGCKCTRPGNLHCP